MSAPDKEEQEMSDEQTSPADPEVEGHGQVADSPVADAPVADRSDDEPDVEAHGPVADAPVADAPVAE